MILAQVNRLTTADAITLGLQAECREGAVAAGHSGQCR